MTIGRAALFTVCIVFGTSIAPAMSFDTSKSGDTCHALVIDPTGATDLRRPFALRYRAVPLRVCMPDDTNGFSATAFV